MLPRYEGCENIPNKPVDHSCDFMRKQIYMSNESAEHCKIMQVLTLSNYTHSDKVKTCLTINYFVILSI